MKKRTPRQPRKQPARHVDADPAITPGMDAADCEAKALAAIGDIFDPARHARPTMDVADLVMLAGQAFTDEELDRIVAVREARLRGVAI